MPMPHILNSSLIRPTGTDVFCLSVADVEFAQNLKAMVDSKSFVSVADICNLLALLRHSDDFMASIGALEALASEISFDYEIGSVKGSAVRAKVEQWCEGVNAELPEKDNPQWDALAQRLYVIRPWSDNTTNHIMAVILWNWLRFTIHNPEIPSFLSYGVE